MTEAEETHEIRIENKVRLQAAAAILREVLPGAEYGVTAEELVAITKPLAEKIAAALLAHVAETNRVGDVETLMAVHFPGITYNVQTLSDPRLLISVGPGCSYSTEYIYAVLAKYVSDTVYLEVHQA